MRFILNMALLLGVALAFGFGLSWYALTDGRFFGTLEIGPWVAWRNVGNPSPDPYTRAFIARTGGLELGAGEGMQFVATTDSDSRRLDRACSYRIDGTTPVARFWTLTAVEPATGAVATRADGPRNAESGRLARAADGSIELHVGKRLEAGNWLEIAGDGPFDLLLTLYDTSSLTGAGTEAAALPAILREGCA